MRLISSIAGLLANQAGVRTVAGTGGNSSQWPGATHTADSASQADVTTKLALASAGDTVEIPAGSGTWSSNFTIPAGVRLKGAGGGYVQGTSTSSVAIGTGTKSFTVRSSSKLNSDSNSSAIYGFTVGETVSARCKYNASNYMTGTVSSWNGTTLVLDVSTTGGSGTLNRWNFQKRGATQIARSGGTITMGSHATYSTCIQDVEITNNASGQGFSLSGNGSHAMVILDKLTIICATKYTRLSNANAIGWMVTRTSIAWDNFNWGVSGPAPAYGFNSYDTGTTPTTNWNEDSYWGADDTTGKKNIYFEDCYFVGGSSECTDFYGGSRVVMRDCVFDNSSQGSHGADTANEGLRTFEMYNCLCTFEDNGNSNNTSAIDTFFYHRGGPAVWTDCEVDDITSSEWGNKAQWRYTIQNLRRNSGPYACYTTYPVPQQIGWGWDNGANALEGFYYWNLTGTGNSPSASDYDPDECGNGQTTSSYVVADRDIFASAKPGYSKYTYPHPLRPE